MSGVSSKEIVHVVVGVGRKKNLKQYCLDHDMKMTEFFCQVIDDLPPDRRRLMMIRTIRGSKSLSRISSKFLIV